MFMAILEYSSLWRIIVTFVLNCIYTRLQDCSADKKAEGRKMSVLINRLQMYHPLLTHGHVWTPSASRSYFTCDPMQALHREHSVSKSTCYSKNIAANIWKPQYNLPQPVAFALQKNCQLFSAYSTTLTHCLLLSYNNFNFGHQNTLLVWHHTRRVFWHIDILVTTFARHI